MYCHGSTRTHSLSGLVPSSDFPRLSPVVLRALTDALYGLGFGAYADTFRLRVAYRFVSYVNGELLADECGWLLVLVSETTEDATHWHWMDRSSNPSASLLWDDVSKSVFVDCNEECGKQKG